MPFTPKDWKDLPDITTPLSATAFEDMETRLSGYTDTQIAAEAATRASADTSEATTRAAAITAEASARSTADTNNYNSLRAMDADLAGAWRPWDQRNCAIYNGTGIASAGIMGTDTTSAIPPATASQYSALRTFNFVASQYAVPNYTMKFRLRTTLYNNDTTLATNIMFYIQAVSGYTSAPSGYAVALQSAGAFTTWPVHNSGVAALTPSTVIGPEFYAADLNVGGWVNFAFTVQSAGSITGGTNATIICFSVLEYRYVAN